MGFLGFQKPFRKESVNNYTDVLEPLANAHRHSTVTAEFDRRRSQEGRNSSGDAAEVKKKESSEERGVLSTRSSTYSPYTIEGLRAEINEDVGASGHDSAYDCELYFLFLFFLPTLSWEMGNEKMDGRCFWKVLVADIL